MNISLHVDLYLNEDSTLCETIINLEASEGEI